MQLDSCIKSSKPRQSTNRRALCAAHCTSFQQARMQEKTTTHPVFLREDAGNVARLLALAAVALYAGVSSNLGLAQPVCTICAAFAAAAASTAAALSVTQQVITTGQRDLQA
eukprot:2802-Heterococcus_DN1.PRE.1